MKLRGFVLLVAVVGVFVVAYAAGPAGDAALGAYTYDDFEPNAACAECHTLIERQYDASMMSQSFTHEWDEIEYFDLALPHADKVEKVAGVKAGCNGCHAPLAFLAGDIPPKRPAEGSRANEGVSCDLCHSIVGFEGDVPFNFNFIVEPGEVQQGVRTGTESPGHEIAVNESFSWSLPDGIAPGPVTVTATVWYSRVVASVAEFLNIPAAEITPVKMSDHAVVIDVDPSSS